MSKLNTRQQAEAAAKSQSGALNAAKLLTAIGEKHAAEILKRLPGDIVQRIGYHMMTMTPMNAAEINALMVNFMQECVSSKAPSMSRDEYTKVVLTNALGVEAAESVIEKILLGADNRGLDSLRWLDPQLIAGIIRSEHPQIQAIVVAYLPHEIAGKVVRALPEDLALDVVLRMANMESIDPQALQELNISLEKKIQGVSAKQTSTIGGVKNVAQIFNTLERGYDKSLLAKIGEIDNVLQQRIGDLMFVFDDLINMPDRDFQRLMRDVPTDRLALALKGNDNGLREKAVANMSTRAAEIFLDDMDAIGPVKIKDVEQAQREILTIAKNLAEAGEVVLSENSDEIIS
jgi:flagellar motor switch protein FliG